MSLYANTEVGVAVLESFWASRAALIGERADYRATAQGHDPACHGYCMRRAIPGSRFRTGGAAGYRGGAPAHGGMEGCGRGSRPRTRQKAMGHRRTGASGNCGFCGALLLVDWNSGHSISETIWDSPQTLAASRSVAARVRVETVKSTGCVIRALEEYDLVSTLRVSAACEFTRVTGRGGAVLYPERSGVAAPVTSKRSWSAEQAAPSRRRR